MQHAPNFDQTLVSAAQQVGRFLLDVFDTFCAQHDLPYMLDAGTLLGAVRQGGFIPWDDDVDVLMNRDDFERLLVVSPELPVGIQLSGPDVRSDEVARLVLEDSSHGPHGERIHMDIFVIDAAPDKRWKRHFWAVGAKSLQALKASTTPGIKRSARGFVLFCLKPVGLPLGRRRIHRIYRWWVFRVSAPGDTVRVLNHANWHETDIPRRLVEHTRPIGFADGTFPVPADPDGYLRILYGDDYLTPRQRGNWSPGHVQRPLHARLGTITIDVPEASD